MTRVQDLPDTRPAVLPAFRRLTETLARKTSRRNMFGRGAEAR